MRIVWMGMMSLFLICSESSIGQSYPTRPIRIVTSEAGGGNDLAARLIAQGIAGPLGKQVIVDNRPLLIGIEAVAKALPDGYTLLVNGTSLWIRPMLEKTVYSAVNDFAPVAALVTQPSILVVGTPVPINSVNELIAVAKAKPRSLNYAMTQIGGPNHLFAEMFDSMAGIEMSRVGYKGTAQALNDVISGEVQVMFANISAATPHIKTNRLKILAVTSAAPSLLVPGVPTIAASGLPGYEAVNTTAMFVPANTPEPIIRRLNQEVVRVLNLPEAKERLLGVGVETSVGSPEDLAAMVRNEIVRWDKVIKDASIHVN
jgi:tripartite-type tricarboxylate transporter receptor subunit TctC